MKLSKLLLLSLAGLGCIVMQAQTVQVLSPAFSSTYNVRLLCPQQVLWTIHKSDLGTATREPSWLFRADVPHPSAKATHNDYTGSGYDRGHLCPAADRSSSLSMMRATFVTSNIAPQRPALNRGAWKKSEVFCRKAAERYDSVKVVAIPLFLDRDTVRIGSHRLAVPHAFVKVAWLPANDSVIGQWFFFNY